MKKSTSCLAWPFVAFWNLLTTIVQQTGDDVVPWWTQHAPDRECGGLYSCLDRDGSVYAGDKYLWMLGRQVWMFSHLANRHQRKDEWVDLARHGESFLRQHAFFTRWQDELSCHVPRQAFGKMP